MKIHYQGELPMIETETFKKFEKEYDSNADFLENFSNLLSFSGRIISLITDKELLNVSGHVIENSVQTLRSIKLCCSIGSFADANTLVRRLRDDLLLYVYTLAVVNQRKPFTQDSLDNFKMDDLEAFVEGFSSLEFNQVMTDDEKAVEAWLTNKVVEAPAGVRGKLSFKNYMNVLEQNENIKEVLTGYNLQGYWKVLTGKLNNYVHNNGRQFSQHNLIRSSNAQLDIYLGNVNTRISYILTFFLITISMVESALLCSGDIEDYLDMGMDPPEDCQYEIAPFIQEYIDNKVSGMHPELKQFLKDNNNHGMKIE
ncbi:hypothetical protein [Flavobacterium sp. KACC 22763]|uniref:hypothetical protein n=1 Tax=Flavobacterium sp. KACC 22763 TaxID=3025668 RepID=UPI0023652EC8|nr:hypothetical protein [Flavobacterium sp. KACC 22763]WDF65549.1 hypothetical protein PQ463_05145 [Flavobacterium sp. KACC 22763]